MTGIIFSGVPTNFLNVVIVYRVLGTYKFRTPELALCEFHNGFGMMLLLARMIYFLDSFVY